MRYLCFLLVLSSCYLGPKNTTPDIVIPTSYTNEPIPSEGALSQTELSTWWTQFDDPVLNQLISCAIQKNFTVRTALETISQARASLTIARATLFPSLNGFGAAGRLKLPKDQVSALVAPSGIPTKAIDLIGNFFALGLDSSWELDFFGKNLSARQTAYYNLKATEEQAEYAKIIVIAEVARLYTHIRSLQQQILVNKQKVHIEKQLLSLSEMLLSSGLASTINTETASASLYNTQSTTPVLKQELEQSYQDLSLLLGGDLSEMTPLLRRPGRMPLAFGKVPLGLPSDLLKRRPDILEAEYNLYAAGAQIGQAKANLFPSFSLTGLMGNTNRQIPHLFRPASRFWLIAPTVDWSLFQGGKVLAQIQSATAAQKIAAIHYEDVAISAVKEVEKALIGYREQSLRTQDLVLEYKAKKNLTHLSQSLLSSGLSDLSSLLLQYQELFTTQMQCIQGKEEAMENLILLYKALGGGWELTQGSK